MKFRPSFSEKEEASFAGKASSKVLSRVKKLLALSGSDNEHEASLAIESAQQLLSKYNLTIESLDDLTKDDTEIREDVMWESGRMSKWRTSLCTGVSRAFGCRTLIRTGHRNTQLLIVGTNTDIIITRVTLDYLEMVIDRLAEENAYGMGRTYANSYRLGLVARLSKRLRDRAAENDVKAREQATAAGMALVLRKDTALDKYFEQFTGTYNSGKSNLDNSAYNHGWNDGSGISLNQQLKGNKSNTWGRRLLE